MKPIEIRTGSDSDIPKIKDCYGVLDALGLAFSPRILSAHRTPDRMVKQAGRLAAEGFLVSIAAAGGSAHLPGMTAAETTRPVIGIPVRSSIFNGLDSLLSIIQMPEGVPTGSVGIGDASNAGLCAAKIAALHYTEILPVLRRYMGLEQLTSSASDKGKAVAVFNAAGAKHADAVASTTDMLTSFGLDVRVYSPRDAADGMTIMTSLDRQATDTGVVIALCDVMDSGTVPASIGAATHLPVIGLPLLPRAEEHDPVVVLERLQEYVLHRPLGRPANGMVSMGINRIKNTVLYALQILATVHEPLTQALLEYRKNQRNDVVVKDNRLIEEGIGSYL
jgi:5-(carboxyamino)imidazole ribonucleotide mutase